MAAEKNYYTIDPMGKLACVKCGVPLVKGKAKFMSMCRRNWHLARWRLSSGRWRTNEGASWR